MIESGQTCEAVAGWLTSLPALPEAVSDDADRVDALRALEELKCAAAAAQAELAADLDASQRRAQAERGVPAARRGRGVAQQVGLARRESPHRAAQHLGLAKVLRGEMPFLRAAFAAGAVSEWKAMVLVRETACLAVPQREQVDRMLAGTPERVARLERMSERDAAAAAMKLAARLDPAAVVKRRSHAESERRVSIRPAPDQMVYLTGLLPVAQGVAVHAALTKHADARRAQGDGRGRGQIMADTLVERVTGQATAADVPISLSLVMTDRTLHGPLGAGGRDEPARVGASGIAPVDVPARLARDLVATSLERGLKTWLRRIYTDPDSGALVGMDAHGRLVPPGLAKVIRARDGGVCRTPWCDAPIQHLDHLTEHQFGGATSEINLDGLCEGCNHAKQAPGWTTRGDHPPGQRHRITVITPTGHTYQAQAPPLPGFGAGPPEVRYLTREIYRDLPRLELACSG